MFQKVLSILECSRVFSAPMTIFSWLIIFMYSYINSGKIFYGLLAFVGLFFAHLGTNLFDDIIDYKFLIKQLDFDKDEYIKHSQKTKCRYIINGLLSEKQVLLITVIYFMIASLIGLFLFVKCGVGVLYYAFAGALIAITYPILSRICLSEVAVALAFGPVMFGGVYYVMTGANTIDAFVLSIPTMLMTVILLYVHTVMDYEFDMAEGKKTIANRFDSQLDSLIFLKWLIVLAYVSVIFLCVFDIADWQVLLVYLTLPLAIDLYKSLELFATNSSKLPKRRWYHFPMEGLDTLTKSGDATFMMRMLQARNLMNYFSLFLTIGLIISLGV